jgi:Mn-dependent DtxR family transcriptional regulator
MDAIQGQALAVIKKNPGSRTSRIVELLALPRKSVEDAIWELWSNGTIEIDPDSTLRVTREGEKVFRYFYP